ncbi:hypothetical protein RAM_14780 [Amycolatopsis mediterranei S699]|uniref:NACHT N-terminal Helical domain-containing protein n=1 Tax=Amycolatopsis mediterranei (strain S699) TaxID=713604 RepID=A0A9R0U869_AMYMS|nr:hypothetical protein RAM_14780 [Amycolatopsis mediterranei S699]
MDRLLGGALLAASAGGAGFVLSLFDAKAELARLSVGLVNGLRARVSHGRRTDRTERIAAAHSVLVVAAFFECLAQADVGFDVAALDLSKADQRTLAASVIRTPVPLPAPQLPYEASLEVLRGFYADLARPVLGFIQGLAVWDGLDETRRDRLTDTLLRILPERAVARYEECFRRLAVDFPEVAFWANLVDHQATRADLQALRHGLAGIERVLADLAGGREPDEWRLALARAYQAALVRTILPEARTPDGVTLPALGAAYIDPSFRVAETGTVPADEGRWQEIAVRDDLQEFLLGHLTAPQAIDAPLVILGQPGSGKSVLTQVLAARLPPSEFLVVRVVLREVAADAELQDQIERALRLTTGESMTWPEMVRGAGDALPVVLMDGFDELLQTTGVNQSDYFERVANFQRREAVLGRPVAIVVTSRTVVADRARPVAGMVTIRLEPFDDGQVRRWLDVWNTVNRPIPAEAVLAHSELAAQPLLLLLLALYHADGQPLHSDDQPLGQAELYERLLSRFAEREVGKLGAGLPAEDHQRAVDRELLRLSVVAFAMFNRRQQWVSAAEVDTDLAILLEAAESRPAPGLRAPLTAGEDVIGKFFFIHRAQARRGDQRLTTYEFLHATFGEYLIARLVARELDDLVATAELGAVRTRKAFIDDAFPYALLSFAPLTMRHTAVYFLNQRLEVLPRPRRSTLRQLLLSLFHRALMARHAGRYDEYQPDTVSVPARHATYSANLLLLIVSVGGEVSVAELFPDRPDPIHDWQEISSLWQAVLPEEGWMVLIDQLMLTRGWEGDRRTLTVAPTTRERVEPFDPFWAYDFSPDHEHRRGNWYGWLYEGGNVLRTRMDWVADRGAGAFAHALEPLSIEFGNMVTTFFDFWQGRPVSAAHALIALWTASGSAADQEQLVHAHETCLRFAIDGFAPHDADTREYFRKLYLSQLVADRDKLPPKWIDDATHRLLSTQGADKERTKLAMLARDYLGVANGESGIVGERG